MRFSASRLCCKMRAVERMKKARAVILLLFAIGLWASIDLGYNFFYSLIPEVNDGITICGIWAPLLLPDYGWSRLKYLELFRGAVCLTAIAGVALIASFVPVKE